MHFWNAVTSQTYPLCCCQLLHLHRESHCKPGQRDTNRGDQLLTAFKQHKTKQGFRKNLGVVNLIPDAAQEAGFALFQQEIVLKPTAAPQALLSELWGWGEDSPKSQKPQIITGPAAVQAGECTELQLKLHFLHFLPPPEQEWGGSCALTIHSSTVLQLSLTLQMKIFNLFCFSQLPVRNKPGCFWEMCAGGCPCARHRVRAKVTSQQHWQEQVSFLGVPSQPEKGWDIII